jgi:hypothetical protein
VRPQQTKALSCETPLAGAIRNVVGIESGAVSGVIKPRSPAYERRLGDHAMMSVTTKPEFSQPAIETSCGLFDGSIRSNSGSAIGSSSAARPRCSRPTRPVSSSTASTPRPSSAWGPGGMGTGSTRVYCGATVRVMAQGRSHSPPSVSPVTGVNPPRQRRARHGRPRPKPVLLPPVELQPRVPQLVTARTVYSIGRMPSTVDGALV